MMRHEDGGGDRFELFWKRGNELNVENTGTRREKRLGDLEFSNAVGQMGPHSAHLQGKMGV